MNPTSRLCRQRSVILLATALMSGRAFADRDALVAGFDRPPVETKPACYWYWISDQISKPGITKDLEAMAHVGIGEAFIGNIYQQRATRDQVKVLTDAWFDTMAHAIREGGRTGVKVGMFNCPGWSQAGGPWVPDTQAMRYLTSSSVTVKGPAKFSQKLAPVVQPFQDVAVLAYPAPLNDGDTLAARKPNVTASVPTTKPAAWSDGDSETNEVIAPRAKGAEPVTIDLRVGEPFTARSLTLLPGPQRLNATCDLLAEDDSGTMRLVKTFRVDRTRPDPNVGPMPRGAGVASFPAVTSKHFAVRFRPNTDGGATGLVDISELRLSGAARLEEVTEKQLGRMHPTPRPLWDSYVWSTQAEPDDGRLVVDRSKIQNLSERLAADGTVTWDVPPGEWVIERIGMTPTGTKNSPAAPEGRGNEIDKMSRAFLQQHFDAYVGRILSRLTPEEQKAVGHVIADSYEQGSENWTEGFDGWFKEAYGYDPVPWLPVLSGRLVGSAQESERFLWDMRRLIADRIATGFVGGMRDVLNKRGIRLWLENYGHWGFPSEFMKYGGQSDDIGGEFWAGGESALGSVELRAAASAAHGYGKTQISAEAFTGGGGAYKDTPWSLKARGDWAMAEGINHFVLHVYIHQPNETRGPGVNAWFGTEFNRKNTWFLDSKAWIDYLRRSQFLLRQGTYVADVAYFIGDDAPKMTGPRDPALPAGYNFDFINSELIERATVKDNRLVLPSGMSYRLLVLPPQKTMRPALVEKLKTLVADGAAILGPAPTASPSMQNYPACDEQVRTVARELWQLDEHGNRKTETRFGFGRGRVFDGVTAQAALDALQTPADVTGLDATLLWTHRAGPGFDLYFLSNQAKTPRTVTASFRVSGRQPEVWNAVDATRRDLPNFTEKDGRTDVPLTFGPNESLFVVFAKPASAAKTLVDNFPKPNDRLTVEGPWAVSFDPTDGAPKSITFDRLTDWTKRPEPAIRGYSGKATYAIKFDAPASVAKDLTLLNLGPIDGIARVRLNGTDVGTVWCAPWNVDVSNALKPGENALEVDVTNNWVNQLLAEKDKPKAKRAIYTFISPNLSTVKPQPSGLIGPVVLQSR